METSFLNFKAYVRLWILSIDSMMPRSTEQTQLTDPLRHRWRHRNKERGRHCPSELTNGARETQRESMAHRPTIRKRDVGV